MEQQQVIDELKRVATFLGKSTLARSEFARHGRFTFSTVERTFGSWNKAVEAAGLMPNTLNRRLSDAKLAREFRRVLDVLGKTPTRAEFSAAGKHSPSIYERTFGSWRKAVAHYLGTEAEVPPQSTRHPVRRLPRKVPGPHVPPSGPNLEAKRPGRTFGPPLNFRELRHEPINEQGVVLLFGMVARELGFLVDAVGAGFPDCRAKQRAKSGYYTEVNIEFEFRSSNFQEHGHDPQKCDLIVCWVHDWQQCPIEVLELKSAIKQLNV